MLSESLEKLVNQIQDPAEREATRKDLEGATLRQQDYSRRMNELDADRKKNQAWYAQYSGQYAAMAEELEKYRQGNAPSTTDVVPPQGEISNSDEGSNALIKQALEEARQARAEAAALKQQLADGNVVTQEQLNQVAPGMFDRWGSAVFGVLEKANQARNEYGINISPEELVKKSSELNGSLDQAYSALTAQAREDKLRADIRKEVEEQMKTQFASNAVPLAGGGYSPAMNQFESFMSGSSGTDNNVIPPNVGIEHPGFAQALAASLRAEGKY